MKSPRLAFMFRVIGMDQSDKYVVKITKCHDYVVANVDWMDDERLPQWNDHTNSGTLVPDVDITEEFHEFNSELDAIKFISNHYVKELNQ